MFMAGAFPVKKKLGLRNSLKKGLQILQKGGTVGIAPEVRRRHLGRPRKPRRGVSFLALETNSPILPVYIQGNIGLTVRNSLSRKRKIKTIVGKPFLLSSFSKDLTLKQSSELVMGKVYQLKNVR